MSKPSCILFEPKPKNMSRAESLQQRNFFSSNFAINIVPNFRETTDVQMHKLRLCFTDYISDNYNTC